MPRAFLTSPRELTRHSCDISKAQVPISVLNNLSGKIYRSMDLELLLIGGIKSPFDAVWAFWNAGCVIIQFRDLRHNIENHLKFGKPPSELWSCYGKRCRKYPAEFDLRQVFCLGDLMSLWAVLERVSIRLSVLPMVLGLLCCQSFRIRPCIKLVHFFFLCSIAGLAHLYIRFNLYLFTRSLQSILGHFR